MFQTFKLTLIAISIAVLSIPNQLHASRDFPVKGPMRDRVDFWKKVYTEITTQEAFIHDTEDLTIIYKKVELPRGRRNRIRFTRREKRELKNILRSIAKKNYENLTKDEQRVADIVGKRDSKELYQLSRQLRFQYGLRDRYYKGLIRSYAYLDYIKKTFDELGVPRELVYLPHVESSFNYHAYSKVGAAGIWQFMRSTARLYKMKVSYVVDERRDPLKATVAAGRLLGDNYNMLKSWPLALTAYNHGARSMKRAIAKLGTRDINKIIEGYGGRRFGFASKNFYATFMATVEISENPEEYFKSFEPPKPIAFSEIKLDRPYTVSQIKKALGLSNQQIKNLNPSIRKSAYRSPLYLHKGFVLHIPPTNDEKIEEYKVALSKVKTKIKDLEQGALHIVSRGETLYDISRIYRVEMFDIIRFNQISNPSRIYPGYKLKIPGKKDKKKILAMAKPEPKVLKKVPETKVTVAKIEEKTIEPAIKEPTPNRINKKPNLFASFVDSVRLWYFNNDKEKEKTIVKTPEITIPKKEKHILSLESYDLEIKKYSKDIYIIRVETEETLGHYADWAIVKTQRIRNLNRLGSRSSIQFGQKLKIPIPADRFERFKQRRNEYHLSIQEDFFNSYTVSESKDYSIRRGDTLSRILRKKKLPYWLVRKEQEDAILSTQLSVGQIIKLPVIEPVEEESTLLPNEEDDNSEDDESDSV